MPIINQEIGGTGFNSDHKVSSNFYTAHHVVQQSLIQHPKELVIDGLRHIFSKDNVFTYREDEYGFPLTPDATGEDYETDFSTKILISDAYRYDIRFFPAIIVKANGGSYKPLSFNQNGTTKTRIDIIEDAFGGKREVLTPTHRIYAGAWDINLEISLFSESHAELVELTDITALALQYVLFQELRAQGLLIKTLSVGAENSEQFINDFIYSQSITLNCRTEWRVEIPIENLIEKVVFNIESTRSPSIIADAPKSKVELKFKDLIEITQI